VLAPASAGTTHPAVTLTANSVALYAGHLTLAADGNAYLDDDALHVWADHIVLDLRSNRYVATGNVRVGGRRDEGAVASGDALGVSVDSRAGVLIGVDPAPTSRTIVGSDIGAPAAPAAAAGDPLALPDLGGESPYALANRAVAHLGGDVRLSNARVLVPGGRAIFLPSYVYTYSSDPGYVVTNIAGSSEDVPILIGSTRDSVLGVHFMYNAQTRVGVGVDERIVDGHGGYHIFSAAPIFGPSHSLNYTWLRQINPHTTSTFTSSTFTSFGTVNSLDVRDAVHRSYLELSGSGAPQFLSGRLAWQSFDEPMASRGLFSDLRFHLRTEYGAQYTSPQAAFAPFPPGAVIPQDVRHVGAEIYTAIEPWRIGAFSTLNLAADLRGFRDTLPHDELVGTFIAGLTQRWNRHFTSSVSDAEEPIRDFYPTRSTTYATHTNSQSLALDYTNASALSLLVVLNHAAGSTTSPSTLTIQPWFATGDIRFRLTPSLAIELSRSYSFGFEGQRFGSFGVQLFP
jgi:hypothetical protein